ncbi:hypothetical protein PHIN8_12470 [Polynucleobacter sp. HIN8]|jgi:hypothetical protein|uniref:hypothetical protein n=1 Tax=Polynucleobacter sp. HIN8 TaxID=3047867 RepID=UPI002573A29B|nr:hypothetical protein [Polynucleobacter sp. HIN8]BEI39303.1 hypothetical protein PHIN8_12470 [Polynucleobacter sp. HIN8]
MAISTVWNVAIVVEIGRPSGPWRWGGDTGWDLRDYWRLVTPGGISRETLQLPAFAMIALIRFDMKIL